MTHIVVMCAQRIVLELVLVWVQFWWTNLGSSDFKVWSVKFKAVQSTVWSSLYLGSNFNPSKITGLNPNFTNFELFWTWQINLWIHLNLGSSTKIKLKLEWFKLKKKQEKRIYIYMSSFHHYYSFCLNVVPLTLFVWIMRMFHQLKKSIFRIFLWKNIPHIFKIAGR